MNHFFCYIRDFSLDMEYCYIYKQVVGFKSIGSSV